MPELRAIIQAKSNVKIVQKRFERLRKAIPEISRRRLYQAALDIKARVSKSGARIKYPVNWDSIKQRIAFFASGGFGKGIPYRRGGKYEKSWKVTKVEKGYKVSSSHPQAVRIAGSFSGKGQSNIHKGRWNTLRASIDFVVRRLPKSVVNALKPYLRPR